MLKLENQTRGANGLVARLSVAVGGGPPPPPPPPPPPLKPAALTFDGLKQPLHRRTTENNAKPKRNLLQIGHCLLINIAAHAVGLLDGTIYTFYELMFRKSELKRLDRRAQRCRRVAA